jgi:ribose 5-phosphate isomerase A
MAHLNMMGGVPVVRAGLKKDGPVITDNGNFEIDCTFTVINNPEGLEASISTIPGVIESGLFTGFTQKTKVIVGDKKKCRILTIK